MRPWYHWLTLGLALLFLGGALTYFVTERLDGEPGKDSVDVGFLYDMIGHHEQALQMASSELGAGVEEGVRPFAQEILLFQSYEIGLMEQKLAEWGHERDDPPAMAMTWMPDVMAPMPRSEMPGMASEAELEALGDAEGSDVDALFIALMQDHHEGGVHMAGYAAEHADDEWIRTVAGRMARNQQTEVRELEAVRRRLNLDATPPGHGAPH
jgi:uncharacterized protein (DUF305 family)